MELPERVQEIIHMQQTGLISKWTMERLLWKEGFLDFPEIDLEEYGEVLERYHILYPN